MKLEKEKSIQETINKKEVDNPGKEMTQRANN